MIELISSIPLLIIDDAFIGVLLPITAGVFFSYTILYGLRKSSKKFNSHNDN